MKLREFLENKFIEWQNIQGRRRTIGEFAQFIGVRQTTLSNWWNTDVIPSGDSIRLLSSKLGVEVYDALGLPRPEENLTYIQNHWDQLSPRERKAIRDAAEQYVTRNNKKG